MTPPSLPPSAFPLPTSAKPLGFRRNMVQARRAGRKDVTRRLIPVRADEELFFDPVANAVVLRSDEDSRILRCPYGEPGQRFWVKEDFQFLATPMESLTVRYLADGHEATVELTEHEFTLFVNRRQPYAKTPGRFMYQSLARDKPTLLSVRVERLLDIDDADAVREGIERVGTGYRSYLRPDSDIQLTPRASFLELFESIHGPEVVAANPWLFRLELTPFKP